MHLLGATVIRNYVQTMQGMATIRLRSTGIVGAEKPARSSELARGRRLGLSVVVTFPTDASEPRNPEVDDRQLCRREEAYNVPGYKQEDDKGDITVGRTIP